MATKTITAFAGVQAAPVLAKGQDLASLAKPLGLVEVCRTGVAAMNRGPQGM